MPQGDTELTVLLDGRELARYLLVPGAYTLGCSPECEVQIEADHVSRQHSRLTVQDNGTILLEDLHSTNGTLLDGVRLLAPSLVEQNQTICIGAATVLIKQRASEDFSTPHDGIVPDRSFAKRPARYEVSSEIAQGGMGVVLAARQSSLQREVALKVILRHSTPQSRLRFIEEAQITGQLEHPNIVPVHELRLSEDGSPYYTMKRVKGSNLKDILKGLAAGDPTTVQQWPLVALLTVFQKVCDAIAFAHSRGVIHRDLKPANLMVGEFGDVLVMDWGIAKLKKQDGTPNAASATESSAVSSVASIRNDHGDIFSTMDGAVIGTPQYMSPEQASGLVATLDERSDVFSLGSILYEITTLLPAFHGDTSWEILANVRNAAFVSPTARVRAANEKKGGQLHGGIISDSLDAIIVKAMAFAPGSRYQTVKALQADLTAYQTGFTPSAEDAGAWKQAKRLVMRNKAPSLAVAAVLLVASILGSRVVFESKRAERWAEQAVAEKLRAEEKAAQAAAEYQSAEREATLAITARQRAEREAAVAIAEGERAEKIVAELKKSAPDILAGAASECTAQRFDSALEKVATALLLDSELPAAYWRRAWILLAQDKIPDALDALRVARQKDPANLKFADLIPMVEKLASTTGRYSDAVLHPIYRRLERSGAAGEARAIAGRYYSIQRFQEVRQQFNQQVGQLPANEKPIFSITNGMFEVRVMVDGLRCDGSLEPLRGLEINSLMAQRASIWSLEPLRGMRLVELLLADNPIEDLSPLQGMPVGVLELVNSRTGDISVVRGMPLEFLTIIKCPVVDISALEGSSVEHLTIDETQVADLGPLASSRVNYLSAREIPATDLRPLAGLRLGYLNLASEHAKHYDLRPLLEISTLKNLGINCPLEDLAPLRDHKGLISMWWQKRNYPVAAFWKAYDSGELPAPAP